MELKELNSVCENPYKFTYQHWKKTLNRPITKFYSGDDVNVIAGELRLTKMRPTSFNEKQSFKTPCLKETMPTDVNEVWKLDVKNRNVFMVYCKLNWLRKHMKNVGSIQPCISMNFCTNFSKAQVFPCEYR